MVKVYYFRDHLCILFLKFILISIMSLQNEIKLTMSKKIGEDFFS
jgi:hypothetical protein